MGKGEGVRGKFEVRVDLFSRTSVEKEYNSHQWFILDKKDVIDHRVTRDVPSRMPGSPNLPVKFVIFRCPVFLGTDLFRFFVQTIVPSGPH